VRRAALAALPVIVAGWAGLVVGISFLEAPVKFTAPSLTLAVGLDVGRRVFAASHLAQLGLAALAIAAVAIARPRRLAIAVIALAALALAVQHLALLPVLDARAQVIIAGGVPEGRAPHHLYVALDALKVVLLVIAGLAARPASAAPAAR
jgi:hypothetical protein